LISALHFHGLTTEIPHEISIAVRRGTKQPKLEWPPLRVYRFSKATFEAGVEKHERDGVGVRVYAAAKTVADCLRFRNQLGTDVALEGLRTGLREKAFTPAEVIRYAKVCRVDKVIRPFLETLL